MTLTLKVSLLPFVCALGVAAILMIMPFFVFAQTPELPDACPGLIDDYNVIEGTDGDDDLEGTDEPDFILGLDGDDTIDGKGGVDCIVAGGGFDTIIKPSGDIFFVGEAVASDDSEDEEDEEDEPEAPEGVFRAACTTFGNVVPTGRQLTFAAGHFGGEGDVTYKWFGDVSGEGQFQHPTFAMAGAKLVTVAAYDSEGNIATAGCPVIADAGISTPVYANLQTYTPVMGGVGGAPGDGGVAGPGTPGVEQPTDGTEDEEGDAEEDEEEEDDDNGLGSILTPDGGTNAGRIVLWILIALIIVSLGVLFWQRYYQDEGDAVERKKEKKEVGKDTNKKEEVKRDEDKSDQVIIPPAR